MTPYVFVALVLCGIAVAAAYAPKLPDWRIACLAIVLIFGAFRFQTGYDWLVYEDYYRETEAIFGGRNFEYTVEMEPLFHWLNVAFVYLGLPACVLLIAVTVFNLVVLDRVTGRISRCHPLLWTVYFGMLFIPVQMSAMRQALASSFILMGLLALTYRPAGATYSVKATALALSFIAIATGFQSSALLFVPAILIAQIRLHWIVAAVFLAIAAPFLVGNAHLVDRSIDLLLPMVPGFIAEKLGFYYGLPPAPISKATLVLMLGYVGLLAAFYGLADKDEERDRSLTVAKWLTVGIIMAHCVFASFPLVWNRIMYVTLPWQIAAFCRMRFYRKMPADFRAMAAVGAGAVSVASLSLLLSGPASQPLIPYVNWLEVYLFPWEDYDAMQREKVYRWMEDFSRMQDEAAR